MKNFFRLIESATLLFWFVGYGIFTNKDFCKKDFLLQYPGKLVSSADGKKLEETYPGHWVLLFSFTETYGKYVNNSFNIKFS